MNCENCKNKQATVFYADESGGRHALCASCARTLGKISQYDPSEGQKSQSTVFIPRVTLTSLSASELSIPTYLCENENRGRSVCPVCSCTLESPAETAVPSAIPSLPRHSSPKHSPPRPLSARACQVHAEVPSTACARYPSLKPR